jgi:hypothetical protein
LVKNKTHNSYEKVSKLAGGGVLKVGVCYFINKRLFIDILVNDLYQRLILKHTLPMASRQEQG